MSKRGETFIIQRDDLQSLFAHLQSLGYQCIGPTVRDSAIVLSEIANVEDLPVGWTEKQEAGSYRLTKRQDAALFGFNNGPHSWKPYLFPPKTKLWQSSQEKDGSIIFKEGADTQTKYAFIGVRACDLAAIQVQDKVFSSDQYPDPIYNERREAALIIAVNCGQAAATCFCTSMNTGPRAGKGYDLALTEVIDDDQHYFTVEIGSERGLSILKNLPHHAASSAQKDASQQCTQRAIAEMGRSVDVDDIKELLYRQYDNARWDELEQRCLSCGNCTMACPTCFCSKVTDETDLSGKQSSHWREWDSCFTMDFSYIHGGSIRASTRSRYRQWLVHKLATWQDQFDTSGCVGCGRCISWCPVGIDLTEEVKKLRQSDNKRDANNGSN